MEQVAAAAAGATSDGVPSQPPDAAAQPPAQQPEEEEEQEQQQEQEGRTLLERTLVSLVQQVVKGIPGVPSQEPIVDCARKLLDKCDGDVGKAVNVKVIGIDDAAQGYKDFDKGAAKKYVIDPHGMVA